MNWRGTQERTMIRLVPILLIAFLAGCSANNVRHRFYPDRYEYWVRDDKFIELEVSTMKIGNMHKHSFLNEEGWRYREKQTPRRKALEDRLNAWYEEQIKRLTQMDVNYEGDRYPDLGKPLMPFLTEETIAAQGSPDFWERLTDDIYFAERELGMTLSQFVDHVSYSIKRKRLIGRSQEVKTQVD